MQYMQYQNNRLKNKKIYEVDKLLSVYEECLKSNGYFLDEAITMPLQEARQAWTEFCNQFNTYEAMPTPNKMHKMQEYFEKFEKNFEKVNALMEKYLFSKFRSNFYQKIQTLLCELYNFLFAGPQHLRGPGYFIPTNKVVEKKYTITTCRNGLFKNMDKVKADILISSPANEVNPLKPKTGAIVSQLHC